MGFRSTFVTEDRGTVKLPPEFVEKWSKNVNFHEDGGLPMSSKWEAKLYGGFPHSWDTFIEELQAAYPWDETSLPLRMVFLHDCGGITAMELTREGIRCYEPAEWVEVRDVSHDYGCGTGPLIGPPCAMHWNEIPAEETVPA